MIEIVETAIDPMRVLAAVRDPRSGASLLFLGTTREFTGDQQTTRLHYECYQAMALPALEALVESARREWELTGVAIIHRVGEVPIGEVSVAIAVSAPHRRDAFHAGQWLIDALKQQVPIWKREHFADGSEVWQHPTQASANP